MFLKVCALIFDQDSRSRKLPRVIPEKLLSQLVLLEFHLDRLEHPAGFLRFDGFFLRTQNDPRSGCFGVRLHPLANELMLWCLIPHEHLRWRNIAHHIDPFWKSLDLAIGDLVDSSLSDPEGREVEFAHGGSGRGRTLSAGFRIDKDSDLDKKAIDNSNQQSQTSPEPLRWLRGRGT